MSRLYDNCIVDGDEHEHFKTEMVSTDAPSRIISNEPIIAPSKLALTGTSMKHHRQSTYCLIESEKVASVLLADWSESNVACVCLQHLFTFKMCESSTTRSN